MNELLFDWDDANIAEHDVTPEEAEEVIFSDSLETDFDAVGKFGRTMDIPR